MKKVIAISIAILLAASMVGCGSKQTEPEGTSMGNPVTEVTEQEMCMQTGIDLPAPEGATDVVYSVIKTEEGDIAQMDFTLDNKEMYLRACSTSITSLGGDDLDVDWSAGDISGLYYDWNIAATNMVKYCDAIVRISKEGPGYVAWLDVAPGILYNLCMEDNADEDTLLETANEIFVPLQGEE